MFLKQSKSHDKIYLSFVVGYRDECGKTKHKTVEKIGYLEDLKKQYEDPISHFKNLAKQISNEEIKEYTIKNINPKTIEENSHYKNLGYVILKKIKFIEKMFRYTTNKKCIKPYINRLCAFLLSNSRYFYFF